MATEPATDLATEAAAVAAVARRRREALVGAVAAAWLLATVRAVDPRVPGSYPSCPFHAVTGMHCPGCGSLRALAGLVHGDLLGALGHNALLIAFLPVAAVAWARAVAGRPPGRRTWQAPGLALLLLAWSVLRNIPAAPFDVLAP